MKVGYRQVIQVEKLQSTRVIDSVERPAITCRHPGSSGRDNDLDAVRNHNGNEKNHNKQANQVFLECLGLQNQ
jgi:hypothetical protein